MGINPDDAAAKENWNESSRGHKLTKILMTLHFLCEILVFTYKAPVFFCLA